MEVCHNVFEKGASPLVISQKPYNFLGFAQSLRRHQSGLSPNLLGPHRQMKSGSQERNYEK
jgi:hypothetical protein